MAKSNYKYIFGPIYSWRLGCSLGIDPISTEGKTCNFDCIYCQLGDTLNPQEERKIFVPTEKIIDEIKTLPDIKIDYLTITSRGEPTLAKNLGEIIRALREERKEKICVITNASLISIPEVRDDLLLSDCVLVKLDACSKEALSLINRPLFTTQFSSIVGGIRNFKSIYKGKLAIQIMFVNENKKYAPEIAKIVKTINADEIELNTPLRPCKVKPLSKEEMNELRNYFKNLPVVTVYEKEKKEIIPFDENNTKKRHGYYKLI